MVSSDAKRASEIGPCQCKSAYQDAVYGLGNRVHNRRHAAGSPGNIVGYGCTVCGRGSRRPGNRGTHRDFEQMARSMGVYFR